MDSKSQSPSICERLINFIVNIVNRNRVPPGSNNRLNGSMGSEIVVQFRHTNDSESWTNQIDERRGASVLAPKKDGLILSNDQTILQNGVDKTERNRNHFSHKIDQKSGTQAPGDRHQELEGLAGRDVQWKDLQRIVSIQEGEGKKEGDNQSREDAKTRPQRRLGPLMCINEKSDAYIQRRKKAMSRNDSHDADKS